MNDEQLTTNATKEHKGRQLGIVAAIAVLAVIAFAAWQALRPYGGPIFPTLDALLDPLRSDFVRHATDVRLVMIIDPT
jgi:hypothetical protein